MAVQKERLKPRSLSLAFFNANGLSPQKELVKQFLVNHQIDILLVQETFLKQCHRDPRIANYQMVRNDRTNAPKGGTAIYFKRSLHCIPIDPPPLTDLEVSVCRLAMTGHQSVIIASCYLSPNRKLLKSDLESLLSLGSSVILAGDFNSKSPMWNCSIRNRNGALLSGYLDSLNLDLIAPMCHTRYSPQIGYSNQTLDLALLRNVSLRMSSIVVMQELDSDHRPVILRLGPLPDLTPPTKTVVQWYKLEKALKVIHSPDLDKIPDDIRSPDDIAIAVDSLTSHVQSAVRDLSRQVPATPDRNCDLPDEIRRLITEKNAATRRFSSWPSELNRFRMNSLRRKVKRAIQEHRNSSWDNLLSKIEPGHLAYWSLARSMKSDGISIMPPLLRPNHQTPAFDDKEKADALAESLELQCSPSLEPVDPDHLNMVNSEVDRLVSLPPSAPPLDLIRAAEVAEVIKDLRLKKSPGSDGISNRVLKKFSVALIHLLVSIFNAAMANCSFPDVWKEANVIGIHKPGKKANEPSSYRPISLLSSLGKIYERLLLRRLWRHVNEHSLLPDEQFGFRAHHSCPQQVLRITEHILTKWHHTWPADTGVVFLDVAKAFDKVWHNGLVYKLFLLGVPDRLVLILRDYLSNRCFRYRVEGTLSDPKPVRAGVPQGSVLAPLLFTLYTSDVPRHPQVELALFADDTALYASDKNKSRVRNRLQAALDTLGAWFRKWRIEVNPTKSTAVYFTRSPLLPQPLLLFDKPIPWVRSARYLGVILDRRLTFYPHIRTVTNRAKFVLSRLNSLLNSKSKMSFRNKVTLYKSVVRPIMTYSSVVFGQSRHVRCLQVVQNNFLRKATGCPWYVRNKDLHRDLKLESIEHFIKTASKRFYEVAAEHPNPLISGLPSDYPIEPLPTSSFLRRPRHVLGLPVDELTAANPEVTSTRPTVAARHTFNNRSRRRGRRIHSSVLRCSFAPGR